MTTTTRRRDPRLMALPDNYLDCRDRHDWNGRRELRRWRYPSKVLTIEIATECTRCTSIQIREIVTGGPRGVAELGSLYRKTWIDYAKNYLVKLEEGEDRLPKSAFRLEGVRRWLNTNPLPIRDRA